MSSIELLNCSRTKKKLLWPQQKPSLRRNLEKWLLPRKLLRNRLELLKKLLPSNSICKKRTSSPRPKKNSESKNNKYSFKLPPPKMSSSWPTLLQSLKEHKSWLRLNLIRCSKLALLLLQTQKKRLRWPTEIPRRHFWIQPQENWPLLPLLWRPPMISSSQLPRLL